MITTENITLHDDLDESYGSPYGLEYKGYTFVFNSIEDRDLWIIDCNDDDLDYIIENESVETED